MFSIFGVHLSTDQHLVSRRAQEEKRQAYQDRLSDAETQSQPDRARLLFMQQQDRIPSTQLTELLRRQQPQKHQILPLGFKNGMPIFWGKSNIPSAKMGGV